VENNDERDLRDGDQTFESMEASNNAVCEAIAKAADVIAAGQNMLKVRAAIATAQAVFQRNRGKINQFQTEGHLESLQQLINVANMLPLPRPMAKEGL
jgi:hypothetical protein